MKLIIANRSPRNKATIHPTALIDKTPITKSIVFLLNLIITMTHVNSRIAIT